MGRKIFDQQLASRQDEDLILGSMVEEALVRSVESLKQRDFPLARELVTGDRVINEKRYAIESEIYGCLVYYNGCNNHQHGIYTQNEQGIKRVVDIKT